MLKSKFFTVVIVLTTLAMAAAVSFQTFEMLGYDLFRTTFAGK